MTATVASVPGWLVCILLGLALAVVCFLITEHDDE